MADVLDRLRAELGDRVVTAPAALAPLRTDRSGSLAEGTPLALVEAQYIADVQATCRIASATGTPIVPRGAGSGLAGGAAAGEGVIVLSTAGMRRILELVSPLATSAELTLDPESAATLVDVRRRGFPALEAMGAMLVEDCAVPRSRMADMFERVEAIAAKYDVFIACPAHAGDGNLHPTFVFEGSADAVPDVIWQAAGELFEAALELGGTLSGEHGIGLLKRRWLGDELGETQLALQRQIKAVFDPQGILNPGKMFPQ